MPRGAITKRSGKAITGPGGGSLVPPGNATLGQVLFLARTTDTNIAVNAYADLLSQSITLAAARDVLFDVTYSFAILGATDGNVVLEIDGVIVIGSTFHDSAPVVASEGTGSMRWKATLALGVHTAKVRWKVTAGQAFCRPATQLEFESCTITLEELVR